MLKFNHEDIQDFIYELEDIIADLEEDMEEVQSAKEDVQGVATGTAISEFGEDDAEIADYQNSIEFYEAIKNDLQEFLDETDDQVQFTRYSNGEFEYDEEMIDEIAKLKEETEEACKELCFSIPDREYTPFGNFERGNFFHKGSDEEQLIDSDDGLMERMAEEFNDQVRILEDSMEEIERLHKLYFEDITLNDWKTSHDSHDGIAENSREWHSIGMTVASGALLFGGLGEAAALARRSSELTEEQVADLAKLGLINPESDTLVLGNYTNDELSYTQIAADEGSSYFNMAPEDYSNIEEMGKGEIWKVNRKILDDAIKEGKQIKLTHDPKKYEKDKSFYAKEIEYLEKNGYKFTDYENGGCYAYK